MIMTMITKTFDNYNGDDNNYKGNDSEKYDVVITNMRMITISKIIVIIII